MTVPYSEEALTREQVDQLGGSTLLDFGNNWCGYCSRTRPLVDAAVGEHPDVRHIRVADASGKRLGRSFGVKLWPTLVFLRDGAEVARLVRPTDPREIGEALLRIDPKGG
jgi:thioredoxin 1